MAASMCVATPTNGARFLLSLGAHCFRSSCAALAVSRNARAAHTHFGYAQVDEQEKAGKVHQVFSSVAGRYDMMNDLMSAGLHRLWKDTLVQRLAPATTTRVLDVAGGTGDIAFRILQWNNSSGNVSAAPCSTQCVTNRSDDNISASERAAAEQKCEAETQACENGLDSNIADARVVVCDVNQHMLEEGQRRAAAAAAAAGTTSCSWPAEQLHWLLGDAEQLPIADSQFDAYTIAFGIRNVTHIEKALTEAYRVLKPGGRFLCLEFSHVQNDQLRWLYDHYSMQLIPALGLLVTGDWASYQYLVESIRQFPRQDQFCEMIAAAGFTAVSYENLSNGIVAIHSAFKLPH